MMIKFYIFSKDAQHAKRKNSGSENGNAQSGLQSSHQRRPTQKPSDLAVLSLPWKTTEQELKKYFSRFGTVVFANIKREQETGNSRGFGFIRFESFDSQQKAMEQQNHEIEGRNIVLRLTKKVTFFCM